MISAIILAAGESRRMKPCKQMVDIGGQSMLERVISKTVNSKVSETIVVLGHKADEISEKISKNDIKIAVNPNFKKGMSTSLKQGLKKADEAAQAVLFVLGDQPLIDSNIINKIIRKYKRTKAPILAPVYEKRRGHPVLFDISLKNELMKIEGDIGARGVLEKRREDIQFLNVDSPGVIFDVNNDKDLNKVRDLIKRE